MAKSILPRIAAGQRYGRIVAIEYVRRDSRSKAIWRFQCDCGNETIVFANSVRSGLVSSCGCLLTEYRTRGHHPWHGTSEYRAWAHMLERCANPNCCNYKNYGKRGITVCERWRIFSNFILDMGPKPSPNHSIDRINNDGNYTPDNCRWATRSEQNRNKRKRVT